MSKYGNRKVVIDGHTFDSVREGTRYGELKLMERAGLIQCLEVHPKYTLSVGPNKVGTYTADFRYLEGDKRVVEDVKSKPTMTSLFRWKARHMEAEFGIKVRIVT